MKHRFVFFCLSILLPSTSLAQWVQTPGPEGAEIVACTAARSAIVASAFKTGMYRSTDQGLTWTLTDPSVQTIAELTSIGDTVLGIGRGLFRSSDGGITWESVPAFPDTGWFEGVTRSGNDFFLGYTATLSPRFGSTLGPNAIYRSTDYGLHWDSISSIPEGASWSGSNYLAYLATLADVSGTLLVASDSTVYRSTDRGVTWTWSGNGFPSGTTVSSFAVSGEHVATNTAAGVFSSTDGGQSWQLQRAINPLGANSGACVWADTNLIIAYPDSGIFRFGGGTWTEVDSSFDVGTFTADGNILFAGSATMGTLRSTDQGATWTQCTHGMVGTYISQLTTFGSTILASTFSGVYRSTDQGQSWTQASPPGIRFRLTNLADPLANDGVTILEAHDDQIYRSYDGGATWQQIASPLPGGAVASLAISGNIAVSVAFDDFYTYHLYSSTDGGNRWQSDSAQVRVPEYGGFVTILGDTLFMVADSIVFRSLDRGATWSEDTLPGGYLYDFLPSNGKIFLSSGSNVLVSSDGGGTWHPAIAKGLPAGASPSFSYKNYLFALLDSSVWLSTDGGQNWSQFGAGFNPLVWPGPLAVVGDYVLAGTAFYGVWRRPLSDLTVSAPAIVSQILEIQTVPNPFLASTTLTYSIPEAGYVSINLYDRLGRKLQDINNGVDAAGTHSEVLDFQYLPDGIYICRICSGSESTTRCLVKN